MPLERRRSKHHVVQEAQAIGRQLHGAEVQQPNAAREQRRLGAADRRLQSSLDLADHVANGRVALAPP
jgi:hypothetical protein